MSDLRDPRVFLAAERTLLAWPRTALALVGSGFLVERSGLLLALLAPAEAQHTPGPHWPGRTFIAFGVALATVSALQHRRLLRSLHPVQCPAGYGSRLAPLASALIALLGLVLGWYLALNRSCVCCRDGCSQS